ncbi:Ubiquinone/menaquinone biosynthesis C-methyltransferase UbiE [bacterium HR37]|nr:Ubiquinone/menaquinone biosynthesis C-methyltransferase UbiE [bacterium HR37]
MSYQKRFSSASEVLIYSLLYENPYSYDSIIWKLEQEVLDKIIEEFIPHLRKKSLLDFACGTGRVLTYLESKFDASYGVDISTNMLRVAEQRVKKAKLVNANLLTSPNLLVGPFDMITAFRFFLNAEQSLREQALLSLRQRMHRDSILVANNHGSYPSLRSLTLRLQRKLRSTEINEIKQADFENMLQKAGFQIVKSFGLAVLTPTIAKLLGPNITLKCEKLAFLSRISDRLGSNKIYVLKRIND